MRDDITCDGCHLELDLEDSSTYAYVTDDFMETVQRICADCLDEWNQAQ
jgi:hypothetical protein